MNTALTYGGVRGHQLWDHIVQNLPNMMNNLRRLLLFSWQGLLETVLKLNESYPCSTATATYICRCVGDRRTLTLAACRDWSLISNLLPEIETKTERSPQKRCSLKQGFQVELLCLCTKGTGSLKPSLKLTASPHNIHPCCSHEQLLKCKSRLRWKIKGFTN